MSQVTERLCEHTVTVLFRVVISLEIELGHADIGDSPVLTQTGLSLNGKLYTCKCNLKNSNLVDNLLT